MFNKNIFSNLSIDTLCQVYELMTLIILTIHTYIYLALAVNIHTNKSHKYKYYNII